MKSLGLIGLALLDRSYATKTNSNPDVYGPNGKGYTNTSGDQSLAKIGIDIDFTKAKDSDPKCLEGEWAQIHYVGTLPNGRVVADSRSEPGGLPKTFTVGKSEVLRCWDFAIQALHSGDRATV